MSVLKNHEKLTIKKGLTLFLVFIRIGLFTFGGGYAMIPLIQKEIIEKKKWLTEIELMDILIISESTPGPVAINVATYVGYHICGFFGSLISTIAISLPSFLIIYLISLFFDQFMQITWIQNAFKGIQAAVAVLIISTAIKLFKKMPKTAISIIMTVITASLLFAIRILHIDFSTVYFIVLGFGISLALVGLSLYKQMEDKYKKIGEHLESLK